MNTLVLEFKHDSRQPTLLTITTVLIFAGCFFFFNPILYVSPGSSTDLHAKPPVTED